MASAPCTCTCLAARRPSDAVLASRPLTSYLLRRIHLLLLLRRLLLTAHPPPPPPARQAERLESFTRARIGEIRRLPAERGAEADAKRPRLQ